MKELKIFPEDLQDYAIALLEARNMSPTSDDMEFLDLLETVYFMMKGQENE